jgi:hypothetical protein
MTRQYPFRQLKWEVIGDSTRMENVKSDSAAARALAEAEQRRKEASEQMLPKEVNGRKGPEPTRFGDWETKGITSDF